MDVSFPVDGSISTGDHASQSMTCLNTERGRWRKQVLKNELQDRSKGFDKCSGLINT